jgi:signal peptidase II
MKTRLAAVLLAILVLAADQGSKYWVLHNTILAHGGFINLLPVLDFALVWNPGVTFGLFAGAGGTIFITLFTSAVIIGLGVWLRRSTAWHICLPIGAIIGGAIGNVIDRLHHGAVVDFIQAHLGPYSFYVFNVGDSAIVCGVFILMLPNLLRPTPGGDRKAA